MSGFIFGMLSVVTIVAFSSNFYFITQNSDIVMFLLDLIGQYVFSGFMLTWKKGHLYLYFFARKFRVSSLGRSENLTAHMVFAKIC